MDKMQQTSDAWRAYANGKKRPKGVSRKVWKEVKRTRKKEVGR